METENRSVVAWGWEWEWLDCNPAEGKFSGDENVLKWDFRTF